VHRRLAILSLTVAAAALAAPASGQAALTIGGDASSTAFDAAPPCTDPAQICTIAPLANPIGQVAAPFDGVVVRWRVFGDSRGSGFRLRILRPLGGGLFTGAGTGEPEVVAPGAVRTFGTRLPIHAGDLIGVDVPGGPGTPPTVNALTTGGAQTGTWVLTLGDEAPGRAPTSTSPYQLRLDAAVEADCDGDGFGDETQDGVADCAVPETNITARPKAKTTRKKATFGFESNEAGVSFECSLDGGAFVPCTTPHRVKVKKGKHTFSVRARDAAGNVDASPATDDWKVKKKRKTRP
jgi:hypothetical protein